MLRISTGKGFELEIPTAYMEMVEEAERTIVQLTEGKPKGVKYGN